MLNRCLVLFVLFAGAASALSAGEDIMPMAPGAEWLDASGDAPSPQLRRNMVKITLPSLASRVRPAEITLEGRNAGTGNIPGLVTPEALTSEPFRNSPGESWRYHVPEEMRFPMEAPLGFSADIASNQGFDALLEDLVDFDAPAAVPAGAGAVEPVMPLVPPGGGGRALSRVSIPSLPMPSETLRNDVARRAEPSSPSVHEPAFITSMYSVDEASSGGPPPISVSDFGASGGSGSRPATRTRRPASDRFEPEEFAPMRNLRHSISPTR